MIGCRAIRIEEVNDHDSDHSTRTGCNDNEARKPAVKQYLWLYRLSPDHERTGRIFYVLQ